MKRKKSGERNGGRTSRSSLNKAIVYMTEAAEVRKALLARPPFSLRLQLLLGFLFAFLFAVCIAIVIIKDIYEVEKKIRGLEIVNDYVVKIDQARRFEKNFLLYKTDLNDALDAIYSAKTILDSNREELVIIIGNKKLHEIHQNINTYERLLEKIASWEKNQKKDKDTELTEEIQQRVRKQGKQMIFLAQDLMKNEKKSMERTIAGSRRTQTYSLVFLLIIMVSMTYFLGGRMLGNIKRFESYALRIAEGDFNLITPVRRYRDEFTNLAIAINYMIQELEKHEAMLVQSHKLRAIGTLTAGVAHELNNPLNNITLTSHMLLEDYKNIDDEERQEMITDVTKEADRAKKIVANLLDFTRESETKLEPLDLVQLIKGTIDLAYNQVKISGIKINFEAAENLSRIQGDSQQLRQVFLNLILNAIAASKKGGKIRILANRADEPDHVVVKVVDDGTGIPKHIMNRIFDPFFTTKDRGKGTGLGLSVSQGIVAKHGGRIVVESQVNKGSAFSVILPATTII